MTNVINQQQEINPRAFLEDMRKEVMNNVDKVLQNLGTEVVEYFKELEKGKTVPIDNAVDKKISIGLKKHFATKANFVVKMNHNTVPFLDTGPKKNEYRYTIDKIKWTNGPNAHEVFHYLNEYFKYYMPVSEFKREMFDRTVTGITRNHIEWYKPSAIGHVNFKPIQIFKTLVIQKNIQTDEVKYQYYILDVVDKKLDIQNLRANTIDEVLVMLQNEIEDIFYSPQHNKNPRKERLMQLQNVELSTPEPDYTGEEVDESEEQVTEDDTESVPDEVTESTIKN